MQGYPPKLAGRTATLRFVGDRERLLAIPPMKDRDWRPNGIGLLELTPSRGDFYARIPMDAVWGLIAAMGQAGFSYVLLNGPSLFRSKSLCTSFSFERSVDLEDYLGSWVRPRVMPGHWALKWACACTARTTPTMPARDGRATRLASASSDLCSSAPRRGAPLGRGVCPPV